MPTEITLQLIYHAEDAIKEIFLAINRRTLDLMLQAARRIER